MDNFLFLPRALASTFFDLAFAATFGCLLAMHWLHLTRHPDAELSEGEEPQHLAPLQRTLTLCTLTMLLALPAQLWLLTATMLGSASAADIRPQLLEVLTSTHAGRVLIPDFACALLLLLLALTQSAWVPHPSQHSIAMGGTYTAKQRALPMFALAIAFVLAAFRSASGHAASNGNFSTGEIVQFLHLTSIAIWGGAVMVAGLLVLPRLQSPDQITHFSRQLSRTATIAIIIIAFSGIYNAWIGLDGSLAPLPRTQWGILLLIKSALVLAALALGGSHRLALRRNPILLAADAKRFTQTMRLEALVMAAILAISGFLANSPPATGM